MANEIRFSGSLRYASALKAASISGSGMATQVGTEYVQKTQQIADVEEVLVKGDIGTIGWIAVRNADATSYVELGATTGVYSIKVPAGGFTVAPWDSVNVYAKAQSGASPDVEVEYLLIEA